MGETAMLQDRGLLKEILGGKFWLLVIVTLRMLGSHLFNRLIQDSGFQEQFCLAFVDECNLIGEQESGFHPSYESIGNPCTPLPAPIPWVAVSGSLSKEPFDRVVSSLGLHRGQYVRASLPIDNPNICYIPRFQSYPARGTTLPGSSLPPSRQ